MRRWLIILSCFALALILFFAAAYLRTGKPKITVNYVAEYNKITKPENYDPNENASPYYEKAFELCAAKPNSLSNDGGAHRGWRTYEGDYVYWPVQTVESEKQN